MVARDAGTEMNGKLTIVGVFHQAFRETERFPQKPSLAFLRIRKTPLIADRVVGHTISNSIPAMASRAKSRRRSPPHPRPPSTLVNAEGGELDVRFSRSSAAERMRQYQGSGN